MDEENKVEEPKKVKKKKEKKPLTLKQLIIRRIIFILIFLLISSGVTAYLVIVSPFEKDNDNKAKEEQLDNEVAKRADRNHVSVLDYDKDTFDYNELKKI